MMRLGYFPPSSQIAQYFRWRDNDELLEAIGVSMAIECFRQFDGKPLLGDVMPIGFVHRASGGTDACARPPRTVRALLARGRIIALENLLDG